MNIPGIAGPMEAPIKLKSTVIPKNIRLKCFDVDFRAISYTPTLIKDIPAMIARFIAIENSVE
jgi:hypothetical protein